MNQSRSIFDFCREYDGSKPASRWLKRLKFELRDSKTTGVISPELYLSSINILFANKAVDWAETIPKIIVIFAGTPSSEALEEFLSALKERFSIKAVDTVIITFPEKFEALYQRTDESLISYYQRTVQITYRFGTRDRLFGALPLLTLESSTLDLIYSAFFKKLMDLELRREAIRGTVAGISLHTAYVAMEHTHKTRLVVKKIEYEETQEREAMFYKDVVKRNLTATQLESI